MSDTLAPTEYRSKQKNAIEPLDELNQNNFILFIRDRLQNVLHERINRINYVCRLSESCAAISRKF